MDGGRRREGGEGQELSEILVGGVDGGRRREGGKAQELSEMLVGGGAGCGEEKDSASESTAECRQLSRGRHASRAVGASCCGVEDVLLLCMIGSDWKGAPAVKGGVGWM